MSNLNQVQLVKQSISQVKLQSIYFCSVSKLFVYEDVSYSITSLCCDNIWVTHAQFLWRCALGLKSKDLFDNFGSYLFEVFFLFLINF